MNKRGVRIPFVDWAPYCGGALFFLMFAVCAVCARAETIYFKDGTQRKCLIKSLVKEQIYIDAPGGYRTFRMERIDRIDNDDGTVSKYDYRRAADSVRTLMEGKKYKEALALSDELVTLFPEYPALRYARAALFHRLGDADKALVEYRFLESVKEADADVYNNMGVVYASRRQYTEAYQAFAKALEKNPESLAVRTNYANALLEAKQYTPATEVFLTILARDPTRTNARYNLGVAYFYNGNEGGARRAWEQVLAERPDDNEARMALEHLRARAAQASSPAVAGAQ